MTNPNDYSTAVAGWTCPRCFMFVRMGETHFCPIMQVAPPYPDYSCESIQERLRIIEEKLDKLLEDRKEQE